MLIDKTAVNQTALVQLFCEQSETSTGIQLTYLQLNQLYKEILNKYF